jgi:transcriptional regulator with XRE-family HTH domain
MSDPNSAPSYGRLLKSLRIQKNIPFSEICRITRISLDNLVKLESEDHGRLPAPVHVKGFLKAYAQVLGVDPNSVIQRYLEDLAVYRKSTASDARLRSWLGFWPRLGVALAALAAIIAASIYGVSFFDRPIQPAATAVAPAPAQPPIPATGANAPEVKAPVAEAPPLEAAKKLMLRVIAVEPTRLKVIIDGQTPREYPLKPEDRLELEAKHHFNLLVDNGTGVRLFLNDEPVPMGGKSGQAATIQLPLRKVR